MIKIIAGPKGQGKTKQLIRETNEAVKTSDGKVVFIDDDKRHIYDLNHQIRFVDTEEFPLANYREFIGFVYGILSQDNDINYMFVDGITNVIGEIDNESLIKLVNRLKAIDENYKINFIMTLNCENPAQLPEEVKGVIA